MVHSDSIAVHWSTSADTSLSQQLCMLQIYVHIKWAATQTTSVGRHLPMQNERTLRSLKSPLSTCTAFGKGLTCG